ncbi:MAG: hypothetical protein C0501_25965, partial [Isosphaera sp.]|nr:hypothetical protein [Isosphaera sp.]
MTPAVLTCPCGRSWEHQAPGPPPADPRVDCPACRSTVPPPTVPGFEVLEEVGRGSMGVVYKARQAGLNRLVALKVIPSSHLAVPGRRELFAREVRAAGRLNHPNLV